MENKSLQAYRGWAYIFFGLTLVAFLGGLIPAMFMGDIVLAGISGMVVLVSALLSLLTGRVGFRETGQAAPKAETKLLKDIHYTPLDPDHVTFDSDNWLYTRGGGKENHPPHESPPR